MRLAFLLPCCLLAALASAQETPPARVEPPPPPGLDTPGPTPVEDDAPPAEDAARDDVPLPEKVRPADEIAPAVTIRTEGENTVEEYRRDGRLYMVVVTPKRGPRYTYLDTDGDGRLEGDPTDGPMQPVYYTLYEWE